MLRATSIDDLSESPGKLFAEVLDVLRRGATLVAANSRAARALHIQYAQQQRGAGLEAWPSPTIYDWDTWLRELWRDYAFRNPAAPMLLSALQERAVWTRILRENAVPVLSPEPVAVLAMEAWALLCDFKGHPARQSSWEQPDAEHFRRWAAEFERECARQNWISFRQITTFLAEDRELALPQEISLVGFDRIKPAQQDFLKAFESCRVVILQVDQPTKGAELSWIKAMDARHEISACAAWVRERLEEKPASRIGVVVPEVAARRGEIDRAFRGALIPASEDIRQPSVEVPWEFSLGQPLADVPAVRAALLLLRWIVQPLSPPEIAWVLLSGFVSNTQSHRMAIAQHDAEQRRRSVVMAEHTLAAYYPVIERNGELRGLRDDLGSVLACVAANHVLEQQRHASAWAELIQHLLGNARWPGERPLESVEYQAVQRWERLLDEIALLDFDGSRCSYEEFLKLLENSAAETISSPESLDAPVQIMGPLESSGQQFDAVWFMGTDADTWPQRGRLHPLLPPGVQRQFGMPSATPDDDWNMAKTVTERLIASTRQIVFSYPERDKDAELRPSPLIASLFAQAAERPGGLAQTPLTEEPPELEPIPDESGALPWPRDRIAGGAEVLRRQSACPFQSFAAKRLSARPLECAEWGLNAAEKGKILHKILERLFEAIRSHTELAKAIANQRTQGLVDASIDTELARYTTTDSWNIAYLDVERRRLRTRIFEWLECEASRLPFTVEACEQKLPDVHIGGLRLNLRADRIDALPDRSRAILDYKSGIVSTASWKGERPDEPQLPLYAAYGNVQDLSGVLQARIRAGGTGFDGRIRDARAQLGPGVNFPKVMERDPYTEAMREEWARGLAGLASQFLDGHAAVDPRDGTVCKQCDLQGLCRVAELNVAAATENGAGEDD